MGIKIGSLDLQNIKIGSDQVQAVYIGSTPVWTGEKAIVFGGLTYINMNTRYSTYSNSTTDMILSIDAEFDDFDSNNYLFFGGDYDTTKQSGFYCRVDAGGYISVRSCYNGANQTLHQSTQTLTLGNRYRITFKFDSGGTQCLVYTWDEEAKSWGTYTTFISTTFRHWTQLWNGGNTLVGKYGQDPASNTTTRLRGRVYRIYIIGRTYNSTTTANEFLSDIQDQAIGDTSIADQDATGGSIAATIHNGSVGIG